MERILLLIMWITYKIFEVSDQNIYIYSKFRWGKNFPKSTKQKILALCLNFDLPAPKFFQ